MEKPVTLLWGLVFLGRGRWGRREGQGGGGGRGREEEGEGGGGGRGREEEGEGSPNVPVEQD